MAWIKERLAGFDAHTRGIAAIVIAVLLLSFSDSLVKLSGGRFGLAQIVLLRSLVATPLLAGGLLIIAGASWLRTMRSGWAWARSLCLAAMWLSYFAALPSMSFAIAAACYYTSPVWMALMARVILGTRIGGRGWIAVGLSLAGVILAMSLQFGSLSPALFLPLAAAGFYALAGIITWSRCQGETSGAMALNLNICLCVVAGFGLLALTIVGPSEEASFVFEVWPELRLWDWVLVLLLGCLLAIISMAVALAYRIAPTPVVGVFDTAYIGFAALWGIVFFADVPTAQEWLGICLIAMGAILMSYRPAQEESD